MKSCAEEGDREPTTRAQGPPDNEGRWSSAASLQVRVRRVLIPVKAKAIAFAKRKTKTFVVAKK